MAWRPLQLDGKLDPAFDSRARELREQYANEVTELKLKDDRHEQQAVTSTPTVGEELVELAEDCLFDSVNTPAKMIVRAVNLRDDMHRAVRHLSPPERDGDGIAMRAIDTAQQLCIAVVKEAGQKTIEVMLQPWAHVARALEKREESRDRRQYPPRRRRGGMRRQAPGPWLLSQAERQHCKAAVRRSRLLPVVGSRRQERPGLVSMPRRFLPVRALQGKVR